MGGANAFPTIATQFNRPPTDPIRGRTVVRDTVGVALAAIQELYAQNQALQAQIEALQGQNADLEGRVEALERMMEKPGSREAKTLANLSANWLLFGGLLLGGVVLWQRRKEGGLK